MFFHSSFHASSTFLPQKNRPREIEKFDFLFMRLGRLAKRQSIKVEEIASTRNKSHSPRFSPEEETPTFSLSLSLSLSLCEIHPLLFPPPRIFCFRWMNGGMERDKREEKLFFYSLLISEIRLVSRLHNWWHAISCALIERSFLIATRHWRCVWPRGGN